MAPSAGVAVPSVWLPGVGNVMVCAASPPLTWNVSVTDGAAACVASPDWLATIVQVPAATSVSVVLVPLAVHTEGVDDE